MAWWDAQRIIHRPFDPATQQAPWVFERVSAGLIDSAISAGITVIAGPLAGAVYWMCRDILCENGSRSIGKKYMGLEIVQMRANKDGVMLPTDKPASRKHSLLRNGFYILGLTVVQCRMSTWL